MSQNKVNILNGRLIKEHYCYKMHTSLMKISAYSPLPFCRQPPPIWISPPFLQENCDSLFYDLSKVATPYK